MNKYKSNDWKIEKITSYKYKKEEHLQRIETKYINYFNDLENDFTTINIRQKERKNNIKPIKILDNSYWEKKFKVKYMENRKEYQIRYQIDGKLSIFRFSIKKYKTDTKAKAAAKRKSKSLLKKYTY